MEKEKRVADLTVEELTALIDEVVARRISLLLNSLNRNALPLLPPRTPEEQMKINQELLEWYDKWVDEGDEEEQRETFEYLQKALDEDRLSSKRALFTPK